MSTTERKREIRREARRVRDGLPVSWRAQASAAITRRALELIPPGDDAIVSAYMSHGSEVTSGDLVAQMIRLKGGVALPRLDPASGLLEHWFVRTLDDRTLRPSLFGILEPNPEAGGERVEARQISLNFIPGLAFDLQGNRLGMGGGHYDRYLAGSPQSRKIGLAFSPQILAEIPTEPTDVRLDGLISEERFYTFSPDSL